MELKDGSEQSLAHPFGGSGLTWQIRLEPLDDSATLAPTVAPVVNVEPTVQALLGYLRERDLQRDAEVATLRAELAEAYADKG
jgi:hypothetical protein